MFQGTAWQFQPIFDLWTSPKFELGEFNKATFLVVLRHCELIFCLMTNPKCDLDEVEKAMIQVVVIFWFLTNRKCDFFYSIKLWFKWSNCYRKSISASWQAQNATWMTAMFIGLACHFELFSVSLPSQNATCLRSWKRWLKGSLGNFISFLASGQAQNGTWVKSKKQLF